VKGEGIKGIDGRKAFTETVIGEKFMENFEPQILAFCCMY
jgi:hypothetical protein